MKTKTSILVVIKTFFILLVMCCFSCTHNYNDLNNGTYITQSYMGDMLYTGAKFKGEDIWHAYDNIDFDTPDSIKVIRYKEAEKWIAKFKKVDSFK